MGHFEVTRTAGGVTLTARGFDRHAAARWARLGFLALFALGPAAFALVAPEREGAAMIVFLLLGMGAAMADMLYTARSRVFEAGAWSRVRRVLEIRLAGDGDHRHAPRGPSIVLDGVALDPADPARVAISAAVLGLASVHVRHHVSLVFRARVLRVDTFTELEDALALVEVLREALGLEASETKIDAEVPLEGTPAGVLIGVAALLAQILPLVGAAPWAVVEDLDDGLAPRLALAGVVLAVLAVIVQEAAFRFSAAVVAEATRATYGIELASPPSRRPAWIGAAVWSASAVALLVVAPGSGPSPPAPPVQGNFVLGGDRLAMTDIDGTSSPIGLAPVRVGYAVVALDPRTGKRRWSLPVPDHVNRISLGGVVPLASGSSFGTTTAQAFDVRTGASLWSAWASGDLRAAFFKDGCLVLRLEPLRGPSSYKAFDAATGKTCAATALLEASEPAPVSPPMPAATADPLEQLEWFKKRSQQMDAQRSLRESLVAAEQEQAPPSRDTEAKRASVTAPGTTYELDATGERLVLSAARGGAVAWKTVLPAAALPGLPFAPCDGVVLVAGAALHSGKRSRRLRLVGVDAATGTIRFVEHHPAAEVGPTAVAFSAGTALVYWAQELRGLDPATGKVVWSTATR
jgi:hypothetical protein